jgi:hypothetical protein
MKIGILTFHREINKGATIQAFCTQQLLQKRYPDSEIEFIDYWPASMDDTPSWVSIALTAAQPLFKHQPDFYFKNKQKENAIREFSKENINISGPSCVSDSVVEAKEFIENQEYDAIFVGSDIVWTIQDGSSIPSPPNAYMLPDIEDVVKIGFAASTDDSDNNLLNDREVKKSVQEAISNFDFISVRDRYSQQRLSKLGVPDSEIKFMPDPTIVNEFSDIVEEPSISWGHQAAGVEIADLSLKKKVNKKLSKAGYNAVNLLGPAVGGQTSPPSGLSVNERVGLYENLDLLITNRFHGSIFTLKTSSTPVVYIEQAERYPNKQSKVRDLYIRLGIEDQIFRHTDNGDLPYDFVSKYLKHWKQDESRINDRLHDLEEVGKNRLREIDQVLSDKISKY